MSENEYEILVSSDGLPYSFESKMHTTFYFSIKGVKENAVVKFKILNMNNVQALYKNGMKAMFRVKKEEEQSNYKVYKDFKHCKGKTFFTQLDSYLILNFQHTFKGENSEKDEVFFSYNFPYSYQDSLDMAQDLDSRVHSYNTK